jgi:endonuclease YncB( thermonuclease family)
VDGNTIETHVGNKVIPVRLCGTDSPEARHAGAPEASAKMAEIITGKEVQCVRVGGGTPCDGRSKPTNHKRIVATDTWGNTATSTRTVIINFLPLVPSI